MQAAMCTFGMHRVFAATAYHAMLCPAMLKQVISRDKNTLVMQAVKAAGQRVARLETTNAELRASNRQLIQQVLLLLCFATCCLGHPTAEPGQCDHATMCLYKEA